VRKLIVNADDLGLTAGVNRAVVETHSGGVVSSATLMANGAAFEDAVNVARSAPSLSVGCQLWSVTGGRHQQLLDLISGSHLAQADWEDIMHAAVQARVPQLARSFVRILGVSAVHAALNISQQYSVNLPADWNSVFWEQTPTVAEETVKMWMQMSCSR